MLTVLFCNYQAPLSRRPTRGCCSISVTETSSLVPPLSQQLRQVIQFRLSCTAFPANRSSRMQSLPVCCFRRSDMIPMLYLGAFYGPASFYRMLRYPEFQIHNPYFSVADPGQPAYAYSTYSNSRPFQSLVRPPKDSHHIQLHYIITSGLHLCKRFPSVTLWGWLFALQPSSPYLFALHCY